MGRLIHKAVRRKKWLNQPNPKSPAFGQDSENISRTEFKKLVWPTPKQLLKNSTVVLGGIIIVGALLAVIDYGLNQGLFALKDLIDFIRPVS